MKSKIPVFIEKGRTLRRQALEGYGLTDKELNQIIRSIENQSYGYNYHTYQRMRRNFDLG